jgi:glycosyltransferase involved in cell wall biosynthesis
VFSPGYSFDGKGILLLNRCSIKEVWESADRIIPVTTIGKHTIEKLSPNNVVDAIYPGVTTSCVPVQGYTNAFPPSKKLVMTVGINRPRKALDRVILAFAKALQQDESLILYLHTSLEFQGGYDLAGIISDLGIESSIYYSKDYTYGYGITRAELDAIYSMAYCYIGLPCAEGFGYGFAEAMRFGKPVIYSSYGCHTELCEGCGIMVPINNYTHGVNSCIRWGNADIDKAAEALCYLSSHPDEAYEYGQKGKEKVSNLLWSNQAPLIVDKIIDCYNSKKSSLRKQTAFFKTDNPSNFLAGFSKLI